MIPPLCVGARGDESREHSTTEAALVFREDLEAMEHTLSKEYAKTQQVYGSKDRICIKYNKWYHIFMRPSGQISVPSSFQCSTPAEIVRALRGGSKKPLQLSELLEDFNKRTGNVLKYSEVIEIAARSVAKNDGIPEKFTGNLPGIVAFIQDVVSKGSLVFDNEGEPVPLSQLSTNMFNVSEGVTATDIRKNQLLRAIHQLMSQVVSAVADALHHEIPAIPPIVWDGDRQTLHALVTSLSPRELQNLIEPLPSLEKYKIVKGMVSATKDQYLGEDQKEYWSAVLGSRISLNIPPVALQNLPLFLRHVKKLMKASLGNGKSVEDVAASYQAGTLKKNLKQYPANALAEFFFRKISLEDRIQFFDDLITSVGQKKITQVFGVKENLLRAVRGNFCPLKSLIEFFARLQRPISAK